MDAEEDCDIVTVIKRGEKYMTLDPCAYESAEAFDSACQAAKLAIKLEADISLGTVVAFFFCGAEWRRVKTARGYMKTVIERQDLHKHPAEDPASIRTLPSYFDKATDKKWLKYLGMPELVVTLMQDFKISLEDMEVNGETFWKAYSHTSPLTAEAEGLAEAVFLLASALQGSAQNLRHGELYEPAAGD
jgi:hypothetical protein